MPRPIKCRKVCHFPNVLEFLPADDTEKKAPIILTVVRSSVQNLCRSQEQQFNEFTRLPGRK